LGARLSSASKIAPHRREVYLVKLDKPRPAVVLSIDELNAFALDVCLIPITTIQRGNFPMRVRIEAGDGGLNSVSWAKCDQLTTVEKAKLIPNSLGLLSLTVFEEIERQVKICLGFSNP
jgi:mRNA-degrading endonuclease toxin of MazEF toxin-antitoxin module